MFLVSPATKGQSEGNQHPEYKPYGIKWLPNKFYILEMSVGHGFKTLISMNDQVPVKFFAIVRAQVAPTGVDK